MAITWKPRRTATASKVPTTVDLVDGEIGINTTDKKIYIRVGAAIVELFKALTKSDVGLGSVDNTSDASKPVSTAQAAADALKVAKSGDTMAGSLKSFFGTIGALIVSREIGWTGSIARWKETLGTAAEYGLRSYDAAGTFIAEKFRIAGDSKTLFGTNANWFVDGFGIHHTGNFDPATKANLTSPAFTGVPTAPTATPGTNTTQLSTTAFVTTAVAAVSGGAVTSVAGRTGAVVLTKSDVGLGSVDNTSDANKPVSTAQQAALGLKANLAAPTLTGNVGVGDTNTGAYGALQVSVSGYAALAVRSTTASGVVFAVAANAANELRLNVITAHPMIFYTSGVERARFHAAGGMDVVGALTQGGQQVHHTGNFNPATKASLLAGVTFQDITADRGNGTGVIYLGAVAGGRYLYYDGSAYVMPGANLWVNGAPVWTSATFDPATKFNTSGGALTGQLETPGLVVNTGGTYTAGSLYTDTNYGMIIRGRQPGAIAAFAFHNSVNAELLRITDAGAITGPGISDAASYGTIVKRNPSGYIFSSYFNCTADITGTVPSAVMMETNSDGYIRKQTMGTFAGHIVGYIPQYRLQFVAGAAQGGMATATGSLGQFEVQANGTGTVSAAMISFHRTGNYAAYFGLDTDNVWKVGGWSAGAVAHRLYHAGSGNIDHSGQIKATSFAVASNNGAYLYGNGSGIEMVGTFYRIGEMYHLTANGAAWARTPRTFVQSADPGAQAQDGDLWFW